MNLVKMLALVLMVAGLLGLAYGRFSYTQETQQAQLGPLELTLKDTQTISVPIWASFAAIVAGGGLLLIASGKNHV